MMNKYTQMIWKSGECECHENCHVHKDKEYNSRISCLLRRFERDGKIVLLCVDCNLSSDKAVDPEPYDFEEKMEAVENIMSVKL